jgi:hypothetical protein
VPNLVPSASYRFTTPMGVLPFQHQEAGLPPIKSTDVPIKFGGLIIKTTLLILGLDSVDIILGTDWLTRH